MENNERSGRNKRITSHQLMSEQNNGRNKESRNATLHARKQKELRHKFRRLGTAKNKIVPLAIQQSKYSTQEAQRSGATAK